MIWRTSTEKYKNISNGNSNIIGENTKNIHDTLVKKQATQLHYMIEWAREYNLIDISDTFRDVHKKQIIPKEREISYRLTLTQHQSPATPMQKKTTLQLHARSANKTYKKHKSTHDYNAMQFNLAKKTLKVILKN